MTPVTPVTPVDGGKRRRKKEATNLNVCENWIDRQFGWRQHHDNLSVECHAFNARQVGCKQDNIMTTLVSSVTPSMHAR